ncbi:MAG: hypothetical protein JNL45_06585 [Hyphomicrobium sp.]|jgi:hypothetical protein|nr:hypothetical protein [Hyphomicrobium sp.]
MTAIYQNLQHQDDVLNGVRVRSAAELAEVINQISENPGFIAELVFENKKRLEFGVGPIAYCAQITNIDDLPPYLVAKSKAPHFKQMSAFYLLDGSLTEISPQHQISQRELADVLERFIACGEASPAVEWDSI